MTYIYMTNTRNIIEDQINLLLEWNESVSFSMHEPSDFFGINLNFRNEFSHVIYPLRDCMIIWTYDQETGEISEDALGEIKRLIDKLS